MRRRLAAGILIALVAVAAATLPSAGRPAERWAILVGVDRYEGDRVTPLRYAVADVKAVAHTLETVGGFAADHVFIYTSDQVGDLRPTKGNLVFRFGWLAEQARPGDTVVVFFSGHGMETDQGSYLLTYESDARNTAVLEATALSTRDVGRYLRNLDVANLLLLIDACRSDPRPGKGVDDNRMKGKMAKDLVLTRKKSPAAHASSPNLVTIFSCQKGERSFESASLGHGYFTWALIQAMEGKAASNDGRVRVSDLSEYVETHVPDLSSRDQGQRQTPWVIAEGSRLSQFVLSTPGRGKTPTGPSTPQTGRVTHRDGTVLVPIPAGTYTIGGSDLEPAFGPPHPVTLEAFSIGLTPVTNTQFAQFVAATGYVTTAEREGWSHALVGSALAQVKGASWRAPKGPGSTADGQCPVVNVSWLDAQAYCTWAGLRLPTELEWEAAARGSAGLRYPWGNTFDSARVHTSVGGAMGSSGGPDPVGAHPENASPFGCLDMVGSVYQWTASNSSPYAGSTSAGAFDGSGFVIRGGSWFVNDPRRLVTFWRSRDFPTVRTSHFGFRCAR